MSLSRECIGARLLVNSRLMRNHLRLLLLLNSYRVELVFYVVFVSIVKVKVLLRLFLLKLLIKAQLHFLNLAQTFLNLLNIAL